MLRCFCPLTEQKHSQGVIICDGESEVGDSGDTAVQIKQALASSDEEDGPPTLAASVKRWWTGSKPLERLPCFTFHLAPQAQETRLYNRPGASAASQYSLRQFLDDFECCSHPPAIITRLGVLLPNSRFSWYMVRCSHHNLSAARVHMATWRPHCRGMGQKLKGWPCAGKGQE